MRAGFTLLEIMLVLALLVVVAALAGPSVGVTFDSSRLRNAGDQVRTQLAKGRVKAMASGRTYTFRYQPGGNSFMLQPWYSQDDYLESSTLDTANSGLAVASTVAPGAGAIASTTEKLPDGIVFVAGETAGDMRAAMLMQSSSVDQSLEGDWSQPIFFYPDGTSSTARVMIMSQRQRSITLTLRGLTGAVRVGQPVTGEVSP